MIASRRILLVCLKLAVVFSEKRLQYGLFDARYVGKVEKSESVGTTSSRSLFGCIASCSGMDKCVSFFFNSITGQCVLHSKQFIYKEPSVTETGWKYYSMHDASGRCLPALIYYRHLDFCYGIAFTTSINFDNLKSYCRTYEGMLAGIESTQKYQYFKHILSDRTYTRVPVDGYRPAFGNWTLDNGTPLTYFNWHPSCPKRRDDQEACLGMMNVQLTMCDVACTRDDPASFICEYFAHP